MYKLLGVLCTFCLAIALGAFANDSLEGVGDFGVGVTVTGHAGVDPETLKTEIELALQGLSLDVSDEATGGHLDFSVLSVPVKVGEKLLGHAVHIEADFLQDVSIKVSEDKTITMPSRTWNSGDRMFLVPEEEFKRVVTEECVGLARKFASAYLKAN